MIIALIMGLRKSMSLYIEWNSIKPGGPAHGIITDIVHKTLPVGWWGPCGGGSRGRGSRSPGVVGSK